MYSQRWSHNDPVSNSYHATYVLKIFQWLPFSWRIKAKFFTSIGPQSLLWYDTSLFSDFNAHSPSSHSIYLLYRDFFAICFPYKTHCSFFLYFCCSFCLDIYVCHGVQQKTDDTLKIKWGLFLGTNFKVGKRQRGTLQQKWRNSPYFHSPLID